MIFNNKTRKRAEEKTTTVTNQSVRFTEQQVETTLKALWLLKDLHEVNGLDFKHIDEVCFNLWMSKFHNEQNKEK